MKENSSKSYCQKKTMGHLAQEGLSGLLLSHDLDQNLFIQVHRSLCVHDSKGLNYWSSGRQILPLSMWYQYGHKECHSCGVKELSIKISEELMGGQVVRH